MRKSPSRRSLLRYTVLLLSTFSLVGCLPVAPAGSPRPEAGSEQRQTEPAGNQEADFAADEASLLPAWRNTENILILGADQDVSSGNWRTDAIMVLGIDRAGRRAALLSVPRDLYVQIPRHGGGRISTVDAMGERLASSDGGGPALVARVLEQTLGLRIDHWVRIEIDDVREFVDRLGGIPVHLDCPFYEPVINLDTGQWEYLTLPAGDVLMDGETVYWFVRLRLLEGDIGRTNRQRQILLALREQIISTRFLQNFPRFMDEFRSMVATDMTPAELLDAGRVGLSISAADIHTGRLDESGLQHFRTPHGIAVLRMVDPTHVRKMANELWNSQSPAAAGNRRSAECTRPSPDLLATLARGYAAGEAD